jgi:Ca-activated chloride channel family protein
VRPTKPGVYEIVYLDRTAGHVAARVPIEVVPAKATLEAVETIALGGGVEVAWTGPNNPGDFITIVPPAAPKAEHRDYVHHQRRHAGQGARAGSRRHLRESATSPARTTRSSPAAPWSRWRCASSCRRPTRRRPGHGSRWRGAGAPNNPGDFITIVRPDADKGAYTEYFGPRDTDPEAASLLVPPQPGRYELRYVTAQTNEILARRPLVAEATRATLEAPASAPAGSRLKVAWTGPNNDGDFITIVAPDAVPGATPSTSPPRGPSRTTPSCNCRPGPVPIELRYVVGGSTETLARRSLTVSAVQATLQVPATAPAGARIKVGWTGPNNDGDFITVVRPDAERGDYTEYFGPKGIDPDDARLVLPARPGDYEVRYVTGGEARVLARAPIRLEPFAITIDAPASVGAGKEFEFRWAGPKLPNNFFTMVKPSDDPETTDLTVSVDREEELRFTAPSTPGTYELRYVVPQLKRIMARKTIVVP